VESWTDNWEKERRMYIDPKIMERLEREDEREEILAFNRQLSMKGIHRGLKVVPDPIEPDTNDKLNEPLDTHNSPDDLESELAAGDGFGVKDKDMSFGSPRADETVDVDFVIPPNLYTFGMEVESSDKEDDRFTEFGKAVEDKLEFERKTASPLPGISPSRTKYQIETEEVIVSLIDMDIEEDDITAIPVLPKEVNEPCCSKLLDAENNAAKVEPKVKNSRKEHWVTIDDSEDTTQNKERCGSTPYHHRKRGSPMGDRGTDPDEKYRRRGNTRHRSSNRGWSSSSSPKNTYYIGNMRPENSKRKSTRTEPS